MIIVVMGVAGSGKTRVGGALANDLGWPFFDADEFHSPENIAAMRGGVPLTDADREPWLGALCELLGQLDRERRDAVLACSALRAHFRDRLRLAVRDLRYVHLRAGAELLAQRLAARSGHFMPAELLPSQLSALEDPGEAIAIDAALPPDVIVTKIRAALGV